MTSKSANTSAKEVSAGEKSKADEPEERDCGCPEGAEEKCVDILCPRK